MDSSSFRQISEFVKSKYGIDLSTKEAIVEGRLINMVTKEGYASIGDYFNSMLNDTTGQMEKRMINILTTNHTYFMREFEHFEFLKDEILPFYKSKLKNTKDLRIWCGAASTGEEPYMIAMTILQFFGFEKNEWDTKVLATDISTEVLRTAIAGEYSSEALEKMSDYWKRRFFKPGSSPGTVSVTDELKKEVIFRQFNLMDDFPFKRQMHVVFLRNVMIYFDVPTKNRLVEKIYNLLEPGGYLIVGKTEAIDTAVIPFEMIKPSVFRKPL